MSTHDDAVTRATSPATSSPGPVVGETTRTTVPSGAETQSEATVASTAGDATRVTAAPHPSAAPTLVKGRASPEPTRIPGGERDRGGGRAGLPDSWAGEVWGDFALEELLGRGGMGAVYRGRQLSLDRPVAVKVLSEQLTDSGDFRKRFLLEARASARINSPYVVQVHFAGEQGRHHYFAMEYVEGVDLARKLKEGFHPTQAQALDLVIQATRGLVALADHHIVHRDIKPANFMVTSKGQLKLMDFGLVKFATEAHGLTQAGMVMGTVSYFSPEQGRGDPCDERTDIYAMGVMFYELLTGRLPFTGDNPTSVIYQHLHVAPKPPRELVPDIAEPYQSVVLCCLEKDPAQRYQHASDLLTDLERMRAGQLPLAWTGGATAPPARRWLLLIAAAAAILIGIALFLRAGTGASAATVAHPTHSPLLADAERPRLPAIPPTQGIPAPVVASAPPALLPSPPAPAPAIAVGPPPAVVIAPTGLPEPATKPAASPEAIRQPPTVPVSEPVAPVVAPEAPAPVVTKASEPPPAPVVLAPVTAVVPPPAPVEPPPSPPPPAAVAPPPAIPVVPAAALVPVITQAAPAAPSDIRTAVAESTIRIELPFSQDEAEHGIRWWLDGVQGRSGRLDGLVTVTPRLSWSTPGLPGDLTVHAQALGDGRQIAMPLRVAPSESGTPRALSPFVHLGGDDEPAIGRLTRDPDGSWWGLSLDKSSIVHISANWMLVQRIQAPSMAKRPIAIIARSGGLYVLDGDTRSVWHFQGATVKDRLGSLDKPTDLAVAEDGTLLVADQKGGGIIALAANGSHRTLVRATQAEGGFSRLTRLCLGPDGILYALDAGAHQIVRFDRKQQLMAPLSLAGEDNAVDLVCAPQGIAVLLASGEIRLVTDAAQGVNAPVSPPASMAQLGTSPRPIAEPLGAPTGLALDVDGGFLVCYEEHGAIARFSSRGQMSGIRLHRLWGQHLMAADGQGRLAIIDPGERWLLIEPNQPWLYLTDASGFCQRRLGGPSKQGGTFKDPELVACSPDGASVAIVDTDTRQVQRFASDSSQAQPRVFASHGKGVGQLETPVSLCLDDSGMTYVLDGVQRKVSVYDAQGVFSYAFGHSDHADASDSLHQPRLLAVYPEGGAAFIYDEETSSVKQYALDPEHHRAQFVGSPAMKGSGPGSIQHLIGLGCDRLGLLYLMDSKRADIQVLDTRKRPALVVAQIPLETLGVRKAQALCLAPDGQVFLPGDSTIHGFCW